MTCTKRMGRCFPCAQSVRLPHQPSWVVRALTLAVYQDIGASSVCAQQNCFAVDFGLGKPGLLVHSFQKLFIV